jgi:hypothetical protein
MSVWQFLANNERGAIFQLLPRGTAAGGDDSLLAQIPKYITLNQVNVKIAGGSDKLLVVRDVTSIVMNEQIMETKKEMSKLTDSLMDQVHELAAQCQKKLEKLDPYVQAQGAEFLSESQYDMSRIQYRVKDFQQVYDIMENKFDPQFESVEARPCFEAITKAAQEDVKGKYMEVSLEVDDKVPDAIYSDAEKIRQVVVNLFNQSVFGQQRGFVKLHVGYKESGASFPGPHLAVTLENSKFVIKPKDAQRLNKMSQETTFSKILESKVEVNYKIAKIIANALNWDIDFNAFKSAKQVVLIPVNNDREALQKEANQELPARNEQDLFNELEGRRRDVVLPAITEEKAGATGTSSDPQFRVAENYPLKQPKLHPEVLLVNCADIKDTVEKKLGFKCDVASTEQEAQEMVDHAVKQFTEKQREFYSYIMVNIDEDNLVYERLKRKTSKEVKDNKITSEIKYYAFASQASDKVQADVAKAGFAYYNKPSSSQALDLLRHMVPGAELIRTDHTKTKRAMLKKSMKQKSKEHEEQSKGGTSLLRSSMDGDDLRSGQESHASKKHANVERQNILDAKRAVIKDAKQEVTMSELRKEMMNLPKFA